MTKNFDVNTEFKTPNLDSLAKIVWDKISSGVDFITEKMPQIENFCTNHEQALTMFCKSTKWFWNLIPPNNLLASNLETSKNKLS